MYCFLKIWDRPLANIQYIGKIWDGRQTVKSPIVCDFPDIWTLGFSERTHAWRDMWICVRTKDAQKNYRQRLKVGSFNEK